MNFKMPKHNAIFDFFFIKSVPATIWIILLTIFGIVGYQNMVKESLPDLEIPEYHIITSWEGATPAMVEKEITQNIEKELRGLKGLKKIYSSSMEGRSIIAVTFHANYKLADSTQRLQQRIAIAQGNLPKNADLPKIEISSVNDLPIVTVTLFGKTDKHLKEKLSKTLKRKFELIQGIQRVIPIGLRTQVVHILLRPERLKSFGIPATLVRQQIIEHGFDAPWGNFENSNMNFSMKMDGIYNSLDKLRNLVIIRLDEGHLIRLDDVAEVKLGYLKEVSHSTLSTKGNYYVPVVALDILKASGQDTVALVKQINEFMKDYSLSPCWPKGLQWQLTGNQADSIQTELSRGFNNGWQAMLAVFIVLFILLTWREAFIAAFSVPLTLLASIAILWVMGYTFNMLVIVGMVLALGLLVDDFILIMEGMHEAIFIKQLSFVDAIHRTIKTYAIPSFSGSITTILVFVPLVFVGGVDGKFIRVIPVTAAVCLVMSYIISVLLTPAISRSILDPKNKTYTPGKIDVISHKAETLLANWIGQNVVPNRRRAFLWITGALILFFLSLLATTLMRNTLYPKEDGQAIGITVELAADTPLPETEKVAKRLGEILRQKPYFQHIYRITGGKSSYSMSSFNDYMGRQYATNFIGFSCFLIPGSERDKLAYEYAAPIRQEFEEALKNEAGARIFMNPQRGGPSGEDPVQIDIIGDDIEKLRKIAQEIKKELASIQGVIDIRDNLGPERMELRFRPMKEALNHYQVSQAELAGQMVAYMENEKIAKYRRSGTLDDLDIRLGTKWLNKNHSYMTPTYWEELAQLSIINSKGHSIPVWSLAETKMVGSDHIIFHNMGKRSVTVMAKLNGIYVSEVIQQLRPKIDNMKESWPLDYSYSFAGEEDVNNTYNNMFTAFCVAIILVYAVLALLFDSLLYPFIILSTVIFALTGVFFGFVLADIPFSFSASIGIVALVGIVVNDAIIMIETIRNHHKSGLSVLESAKLGSSDRLRPIVSTTVTNFAGLTPLALSDPGWAPLCQAIIFGELTATLGAIILIPALFVLLTPDPTRKT